MPSCRPTRRARTSRRPRPRCRRTCSSRSVGRTHAGHRRRICRATLCGRLCGNAGAAHLLWVAGRAQLGGLASHWDWRVLPLSLLCARAWQSCRSYGLIYATPSTPWKASPPCGSGWPRGGVTRTTRARRGARCWATPRSRSSSICARPTSCCERRTVSPSGTAPLG
jgi:hypothetical protein